MTLRSLIGFVSVCKVHCTLAVWQVFKGEGEEGKGNECMHALCANTCFPPPPTFESLPHSLNSLKEKERELDQPQVPLWYRKNKQEDRQTCGQMHKLILHYS